MAFEDKKSCFVMLYVVVTSVNQNVHITAVMGNMKDSLDLMFT